MLGKSSGRLTFQRAIMYSLRYHCQMASEAQLRERTCLHVCASAEDDWSPVNGRAVKHVFVVMPCCLATIFSPSLRSMVYFFLQSQGTSQSSWEQGAQHIAGDRAVCVSSDEMPSPAVLHWKQNM